ncbi:MAG: ABC transporter ATP-binding protein [Elusimicrobiota bacterium]
MIAVNKLSFSYNGKRVLYDISFEIEEGRIISLSGPNGSGKTTLLKILSQIIKNYSGEIFIDGKNLKEYKKSEISQLISYVPSEVNTPFDFKVNDIILMGRIPYTGFLNSYSKKDYEVIKSISRDIGINHILDRYYNTLSNGEKQLVLLAQSLSQGSKIVVMDEPTSHLDIKHKVRIFEILKNEVKEKGLTVISVLHDLKLAKEFCDDVLFLKDGRLILKTRALQISENISSIASIYDIGEENCRKYIL